MEYQQRLDIAKLGYIKYIIKQVHVLLAHQFAVRYMQDKNGEYQQTGLKYKLELKYMDIQVVNMDTLEYTLAMELWHTMLEELHLQI